MSRQGTQQAGAVVCSTPAITTAYPASGSPSVPADTSRLIWCIHNPVANGTMSISFDGVVTAVEVAAGGYYEALEKTITLPVWIKVASAGTGNLTVFR